MRKMAKALKQFGFYAEGSFYDLMKKPEGILGLGTKMANIRMVLAAI